MSLGANCCHFTVMFGGHVGFEIDLEKSVFVRPHFNFKKNDNFAL